MSCNVSSREGGIELPGVCTRSTLGDLLCTNESWGIARERACVGVSERQACFVQARKSQNGGFLAWWRPGCTVPNVTCGAVHFGYCQRVPLACVRRELRDFALGHEAGPELQLGDSMDYRFNA